MTSANPILDKTIPAARHGLEETAAALGQKAEHARERVGELAHRVKERALETETEFQDYVREHPLKSVLAAAGIGAGLGLVIGALLARR